MGATSSFSMDLPIDIYLSYAEDSKFISILKYKLNVLNYKVMDSSIIQRSLNEYTVPEVTTLIEKNIHIANNIIICISKKSIQSISNAIEMNELEKVNRKSYKYIYLMMEEDFTPIINKGLNSIIGHGVWFPFYDDISVEETMNKISPLLLSCNNF